MHCRARQLAWYTVHASWYPRSCLYPARVCQPMAPLHVAPYVVPRAGFTCGNRSRTSICRQQQDMPGKGVAKQLETNAWGAQEPCAHNFLFKGLLWQHFSRYLREVLRQSAAAKVL